MESITHEELKSIQLNILIEVDKFCKQNAISYSLAYGTLLGAIRHKGYIPWDDDIDLMMLRSDYEKFLSNFESRKYKVIYHRKNPNYIYPFAKVFDVDTIMEDPWMPQLDYGVNIDIFPVDKVDDDISIMKNFQIIKSTMNSIFNLKVVNISNKRSLLKNLILIVGKILFLPVPISYITDRLERLSLYFIDVESSKVAIVAPTDNSIKEIVPKSLFAEYVDVTFENNLFKSIKDYDAYLSASFGEYMKLPPIEQQISHHVFKAYKR